MIESTVRAERLERPPAIAPFYTWEVPQKPVSVALPFPLIDRLELEAVESFRSLSSRGSEIGGVLFGSVAAGNPLVVTIEDYQLIPCDYSRGPLYRMSDADTGRFQRLVEQQSERVVGFFRSHTRKGLSLDSEDLGFFQSQFRLPHHIALLIRPFASKASTAGIFIWDSGQVDGETSLLEFPFRSAQLTATKTSALTPTSAPDVPLTPPAANPAAPKPPARAQIVPIASRREITLPGPVASTAVPVEGGSLVEEAPAEEVEAPVAAAPVTEQAPAIEPASEDLELPPDIPPSALMASSGKMVKLLGVAALTIALFVVLFVYPGVFRGSRSGSVSPQDNSPLTLRVERTGTDLLLTWNRDSAVIKTATRAVLSINDGEQHENVEMDLAQLRNAGSIVYSPSTGDVSFKMEVTGADQTKIASESVRVLRTRPSPSADATQAAAKPSPNGQAPVNVANNAANPTRPQNNAPTGSNPPPTTAPAAPAAAPAETAAAQPEEPKANRAGSPVRPFSADSLSTRLRPVRSNDIPDAPAVGHTEVASSAVPGLNLNAIAAPPAPPKQVTAPPPAPSASTPASERKNALPSGGQIKQAVLLHRKEPEYPKLAKQAGARGQVELNAIIGTDGKLKNITATKGHPMLVKASIDALSQWLYQPTILNGQAVETQTTIMFNFVGDR